jgi:hypothetical protein
MQGGFHLELLSQLGRKALRGSHVEIAEHRRRGNPIAGVLRNRT